MSTKYMYVRDETGFPVGCVAYQMEDSTTVRYGLSILNPKDKFDRTLARHIAEARLKYNMVFSFDAEGKAHPNDVLAGLLTSLSESATLPWKRSHQLPMKLRRGAARLAQKLAKVEAQQKVA